ncbi:O-antigen ligase [Nitrosospira sp. Nsp14]|uniref:O-antigen ligase family protein n=1 Tax=Nitrosospira sp. Nsp14 TaxID=1855333 RepID=UPI0008E4DF40|nr:O-antigen ligase family protein [Nitrosospira sp. Nsp14]SFH17807.1 O-antigen ligase [Nitrosospira sp. Nsp14]
MIEQIFGYSIYLGLALTLAAASTLGLGLMLHAGTRVRKEPLPLLFVGIVAAIMAPPIATGRFISAGMGVSEASLQDIGASFWINRIITLGILLLCAERLVRFIARREWTHTHSWLLFWAFVAFALTHQILNGFLGAFPSLEHKAFYAFLLYFSVFLVAQSQPERCFLFVRATLLFFFACSAVAAILIPTVVIDKGYAGGILGIPIRYYGLATHANTLGPLAVVFMICLWRFPFDSRLINLFSWALAFISLFLSQSKTTIAAALVIAVFLALYRYRSRLLESSKGRGAGLFIAIIACSCFLLAAAISVTWLGADSAERWVNRLDLAKSGQLTTLTGRTKIWFLAWEEFLASPWFGHGPSIWGDYYRFMIGIKTATSAHNQLLQSLSSAGILGLAGLLFYSLVLAVYAVRAAPLSGGISVALVGLMFLRGFLEAPFTSSNAITSDFFAHLLALAACVGFLPPKQLSTTLSKLEQPRPRTSWVRYSDGYSARKNVT